MWDEAFYALATGQWTRGDDAIVVGSLTKVLACPGLRVGYVLADPSFIERCRRLQPEWSLNGLAAAALPDLLAALDLADSVQRIRVLREQLRSVLAVHGIRRTTLGRQLASRRLPRLARAARTDGNHRARLRELRARGSGSHRSTE